MKNVQCVALVFLFLAGAPLPVYGQGKIQFPRLPAGNDGVLGGAFVNTDAYYLPQMDPDSGSAQAAHESRVVLPGLLADSITDGSRAEAISMPLFGEILSPTGAALFVPEHDFANMHYGLATVSEPGAVAAARIETNGYLDARYATTPGPLTVPGPGNTSATMSVFMYFLVFGPPEYLDESLSNNDLWSPRDQYRISEGFRHRIRIGDSDLQLIHLGDGVFNTFGQVAASSEETLGGVTQDFFRVDYGGVNHLITGNQRVLIANPATEVPVAMLQLSTTSAGRGPVSIPPNITDHQIGTDHWFFTFTTSGWFFAEDLFQPDPPPFGGGPGGGGPGGGDPPG